MKKKSLVTLLTLPIVFSFGGCVSNQIDRSELSAAPLNILAQKSQEAVLASNSLKNARLENLKQIQQQQAKIDTDLIVLDYIGAPENLLNSIANHFGYRYLEVGAQRSLPIVNFTSRQETGLEAIKDIAVFVDGYANINVDQQNKTVLLTYIQR